MDNYGIASGSAGLMTWEWVVEQMAQARNYWVCTTRPDSRPHAAPVWGVWADGAFYFGSDRQARRTRNLAHNPEAVVHLESGDDTVIFEGTMAEVTDTALLARIAEVYAAKYPPYKPDPANEPGTVWFTLEPRTVFAWLESDFPNTATRWRFGHDT
jgi:nitroimidazol reductase NimA-like FMN-containing flavoprotein (pyridoxamine 5'-phosphate oxidase superfamily)